MVGIGGSIIKYPMLLYIPVMLGYTAFSSHEVSGISAIQVFFATIAGVWAYRGSGYLNKTLIAYMGGAILIGSFIGGYGSTLLSGQTINLVYAILATIAVVMMFLPKKGVDDIPIVQVIFNKWLAAGLAFIVGIAAGLLVRLEHSFWSNHACDTENPDTNDHCNFTGDYVYIVHWFDNWKNSHRPNSVRTCSSDGCSEYFGSPAWRKAWAEDEHQVSSVDFSAVDFRDSHQNLDRNIVKE